MKKNIIIIISVILLVVFLALIFVIKCNNNTVINTQNIQFPQEIEIISDNIKIGVAYLNRTVWQYPIGNEKQYSIVNGLLSTEAIFNNLESKLKKLNSSIKFKEDIYFNLENVLNVSNDKTFASLLVFDSNGSRIIDEYIDNFNESLSWNLGNIKDDGTYYCSLTLNYHYSSYVQYIFKIDK